jgi:hypothetical protein
LSRVSSQLPFSMCSMLVITFLDASAATRDS